MKRVCVFIFLVSIGAAVFAEDSQEVWWGTNYMMGNFLYGGTASIEADNGMMTSTTGNAGLGVLGKIEMILYKPVMWEISPFDFGVAAKVRTGIIFPFNESDSSDPWFPLGVAAFGTAHMGFKGFNVHFSDFGDAPVLFFNILSRFDYYMNMGLAFDILKAPGSKSIGFAMATGVNYFVNENFCLTTEYTYWNGFSGFAVGGLYKLGKGQKTKSVDVDLNALYYQIYLGQFYSLYWYSFYAGGFYFDDSSYKEGEGSVWKLTSKSNPGENLLVDKALLKINSDGTKWWKVKYSDDGDDIVFEFLIDTDYRIVKLRFRDADTGKIQEYEPTDKDIVTYSKEYMRTFTDSDYSEMKTGTEKVKTPAGIFLADHLVYTEEEADYEWWIIDKVPGNMVKFSWYDSDDKVTGILEKITKGNRSELKTD